MQVTPSQESYPALSPVVLEAKPDSGWEFFAWDSGGEKPRRLDTVLVDRDLIARARFLPAGERVANGDFQNGLAGWTFWHDGALPSAMQWRDGALCVRPGGSDAANPWKTQVSWPGFAVQAGEAYDLRFAVRAGANRNVIAALVQDGDPFATLASWTTSATTLWQSRSHRFTLNAGQARTRLEFDLAGDTAETCLDSLSLRKVSAASALGPREKSDRRDLAHWQIRSGRLWLQSLSAQRLTWRLSRADGSLARAGRLAPGEKGFLTTEKTGPGLWLLSLSEGESRRTFKVLFP